MMRHDVLIRPSPLAVIGGALVLLICSLMRVAGQPFVEHVPIAVAAFTLLVFLIPGLVTGFIAPRSASFGGAATPRRSTSTLDINS